MSMRDSHGLSLETWHQLRSTEYLSRVLTPLTASLSSLAVSYIACLRAIADDIIEDFLFGRQKATAGLLSIHPSPTSTIIPPQPRACWVCAPLAGLPFCFLESCFSTDKTWALDHLSISLLLSLSLLLLSVFLRLD